MRIDLGPGGRARAVTTARCFDHPLALAVDPRGGLLVADWGTGVIYRITSSD